MGQKLLLIGATWVAVVFAYIVLAAVMPAFNDLVEEADTSMAATANMTNFPGTAEAVASSPVWIWFLPGTVGVVLTVVEVRKGLR